MCALCDSPATTNAYGLDPPSNESISVTPDPRGNMGKVLQGQEMRGIAEPDFLDRMNGTIVCLTCAILCHTLRAWQTGICLETCVFKPDAVAGVPDPEPGIL